jgi:hypothetical protein
MEYARFEHEKMPFPTKVKATLENIMKTIQKAEGKDVFWWMSVPLTLRDVSGKILHGGYLYIEKTFEGYDLKITDIDPLTHKSTCIAFVKTVENIDELKKALEFYLDP